MVKEGMRGGAEAAIGRMTPLEGLGGMGTALGACSTCNGESSTYSGKEGRKTTLGARITGLRWFVAVKTVAVATGGEPWSTGSSSVPPGSRNRLAEDCTMVASGSGGGRFALVLMVCTANKGMGSLGGTSSTSWSPGSTAVGPNPLGDIVSCVDRFALVLSVCTAIVGTD